MAIKPTIPIDRDCKRLRITELHAVALLRAKGIPFFDLEPAGNGRVAFIFSNASNAGRELVKAHRAGGVEVNSLDFALALAWCKDLIFEIRSERGDDR